MKDKDTEPDRRVVPRRRVLRGARIVFRDGFSVIDCLVRDESPTGARLRVASVIGIPDTFQLQIMGGVLRSCRVVWRKEQELGVSFAGLPSQ